MEKVDHSDWATYVVLVGSVRHCGDYKVTINPALEVDQYPLSKPADVMVSLSGGKTFSKIVLSSVYHKYVTISRHHGLYHFT